CAARLRAWFELGGRRMLVDDLRWLRRCAASLRNADVVLTLNPPEALANWLASTRPAQRLEFARVVRHPRFLGLRTGLVYLPQLDEEDAEEGLAPIEERV